MKRRGLTISIASTLFLAGCSGTDEAPEDASDSPTAEEVAETTEPPAQETAAGGESTSEPEPEPKPEEEPPEVHQVGELIESPTADLVVNAIEDRDSISAHSLSSNGPGTLEPGDGERLWYVDITWTNNLPQAVSKECHGPYAMRLHAFDLQGREMLMTEQPGFIEGQNCSTGLMQGQTGTWLTAFHSLDEDFGWLVFDDYNGDPVFVALDPDLELTRTE